MKTFARNTTPFCTYPSSGLTPFDIAVSFAIRLARSTSYQRRLRKKHPPWNKKTKEENKTKCNKNGNFIHVGLKKTKGNHVSLMPRHLKLASSAPPGGARACTARERWPMLVAVEHAGSPPGQFRCRRCANGRHGKKYIGTTFKFYQNKTKNIYQPA